MELLSSRMTFYFKRIFPLLWFGFLVVFCVIGAVSGAWSREPFIVAVPVLMMVFGFFLFKALLWSLADEVRDGGSFLLVRKGSIEQRVPLTDIINVNTNQFVNPRRLSLRLRKSGAFGDEIVFIPRRSGTRFNPLARNPVAEALIKRVDEARTGASR